MTDHVEDQRPGCLGAIFGLFRRTPSQPDGLPYHIRDNFLSAAELSFYKVLSTAMGSRAVICPKVRLADLFFVSHPNENMRFYNRISSKHVDFVLCEPKNMKPIAGCELDDSSHKRANRQDRDEFVDQAFEVAGLPLIHIPVGNGYNVADLAAKFTPFLGSRLDVADVSAVPGATAPAKARSANLSAPTCPTCGIPMVLRTVSKGEHQGKEFYGCQNYPKCRQIKAIDSLARRG